jgi:hypothetical protein
MWGGGQWMKRGAMGSGEAFARGELWG